MAHVLEINNIEHLAAYRRHWRELLATTPGANFFQTLEWLEVYWKHYGQGQSLRVLMEIDEGELVGIVPLTLKSEQTRAGRIRFLTYPLDFWGSFYGPIGFNPQKTLTAAFDYLRQRRRDWDVLELRWAGAFGTSAETTEAALADVGWSARPTEPEVTSVIEMKGSWEEYLASRSAKFRSNWRRWERRLAERGEVRYERYRPVGLADGDGDPRWDLYEQCFELARKSWQGESKTGTTLSHESIVPFLRDVHHAAAETGSLDLNLLYVDDRPAAYAYNYHFQGSVYGLRVGYDADFSREGVGSVLCYRSIEDSFARGDWLYDLGPGSLQTKRQIRTQLCPLTRLTHFPIGSLFSIRPNLLRLARMTDARHCEELVAAATAS